MNSDPDWTLYRTFAAVLENGSLSAAGRLLGMTQPSVSRHIDQLEAALGTKLFLRTHRGMSPTETAERLRPHVETLAAGSAAIRRVVSQTSEVAGTVRLSATEIVGTEYLPPILASIRRAHPAIEIDLSLSHSVEDLLQRQADIAIRMAEPKQLSLVTRRLRDVEVGLYAHSDYLARKGTPETMADLLERDLIGFDTQTATALALAQRYPALNRAAFALRTDSNIAQYAAIKEGYGIGPCHVPLARRTPCLIRVMPEISATSGMWLVMHEDLRATAVCRTVFDALGRGLRDI
ncbi:LysR family transcriptional regulator [Yoonia sp.]|uniref:LysR family transcriptional regulator n=1 Tax=Yoonia sp. TaxID=2212373 RepID=UPI003918C72B